MVCPALFPPCAPFRKWGVSNYFFWGVWSCCSQDMSREQTLPNRKRIRTGAEFHRSTEDIHQLPFALVAPLSTYYKSSHIESFDSSQGGVVVEKLLFLGWWG
jgi:hypothetical protein